MLEHCAGVRSKEETVFDAHKARVDKAVEHQIEKNFSMASSLTPHCVPFIVPLLLTRQDTKVFLLQAFLAYVVQSCQNLKLITMSARRIRLFAQLFYFNWMLYGWERRFADGPEASMMLSAMTFCRIFLVVLQIESSLHIPGQTAITASLVLSKLHACGCTSSVAFLALSEGFTLVMVIGLSIILESSLRGHFAAQLRSTDAEAMVSGFRRMLRGICDGEVLLDGSLCIKGHNTCLQRIMSRPVDANTHFPDLLVDSKEEHRRLHDFIKTSSNVGEDTAGTPPCLRVSLQGSAQVSVGVDLFHVPLANLYGSESTYHLLAMRQDTEPEPIPDARPSDIPRQLIRHTSPSALKTSQRAPLGASSVASSSAASVASSASEGAQPGLVRALPQLTELMMLVDTTSRRQAVQQVHLNYLPTCTDDPGMPSLRNFIRPTDWDSVRSKVKRYAASAAENPAAAEPLIFRKAVWFRSLDDPQRYIMARKATISVNGLARSRSSRPLPKLWFHLGDLVEANRPAPSVAMSGISELEEC